MGTVWADIAEALARIDTMDSAAAAADAAEIRRIVDAANAVSRRLMAAFAPFGGLEGQAAAGSTAAGTALAESIASASEPLMVGVDALDGAAAVLESSVARRGRIAELAATRTSHPALASAVTTVLHSMMAGTYNLPMSSNGDGLHVARSDPLSASAAVGSGAPDESAPAGGALTSGTTADGVTGAGHPLAGVPTVADTALGSGPVPSASPGPDRPDRRGAAGVQTGGGVEGGVGGGGGAPPPGAPGAPPSPGPTTAPVATVPLAGVPVGAGMSPLASSVGRVPGLPAPGPFSRGAPPTGVQPAGAPPGTPHGVQVRTSPAAAVPAGLGAQPAARGATGAPMVPMGAARRGDDDQTHPVADYLRTTREGELLLGAQPLVGPAVLAPPPLDSVPSEESGKPVADDDLDLTV